jgi:hypothetical protein
MYRNPVSRLEHARMAWDEVLEWLAGRGAGFEERVLRVLRVRAGPVDRASSDFEAGLGPCDIAIAKG